MDELDAEAVRGKITILPGHDAALSSVTFCIQDEDHTLGNALRYMLMKDPIDLPLDASWGFYNWNSSFLRARASSFVVIRRCMPLTPSIPHPSESKIHMRVQMNGKHAIPVSIRMTTQSMPSYGDEWLYTHFQLFLLIFVLVYQNKLTTESTVSAIGAVRDALDNLDNVFATIRERYITSLESNNVSKESVPKPSVPMRPSSSS